MDKKAVVEIKIVDKLDLPVGEFVGGFRNSKRGARCALFDSLSRGETRGNVVEFQAAPTASRINFRANRIDSGPLAICLDRDKRRSATLEAARRGAARRRPPFPLCSARTATLDLRPRFFIRYIEIASLLELRFPLCNRTKIPRNSFPP